MKSCAYLRFDTQKCETDVLTETCQNEEESKGRKQVKIQITRTLMWGPFDVCNQAWILEELLR